MIYKSRLILPFNKIKIPDLDLLQRQLKISRMGIGNYLV
ncbi:hypothetical protein P278_13990 [Zhouia amylolytica AD3]|uniref:Uncharacterized protein n=1 Tax=Zhouia amylolytica AD3 TaxID=1286632 RepID=W2UQS3_9FLAO|nr:hypothetical protein P278_13990 [Zhouia amylolytica AD3]